MSALTIKVNGQTATLAEGQTGTIKCAEKQMAGNFEVIFDILGSYTYNRVTTTGQPGTKSILKCAGQQMVADIVVTAGASVVPGVEVDLTEINTLLGKGA